jgi:hypothetical protein
MPPWPLAKSGGSQINAHGHICFKKLPKGGPACLKPADCRGRPHRGEVAKGVKTIAEMKLAKNSHLKRNLQRQAEIYKAASDAARAIKVILFFSAEEEERVAGISAELGLTNDKDIVLIDARADNKPSGSKA